MKSCLLALLLLSALANGQTNHLPVSPAPKKYAGSATRIRLSLLSGYQREDFRWSIAGNSSGANPNIFSELIWTKLAGPLAGAEGEWNFWKCFWLRSAYSRFFIVSGNVTDMDYLGDNRTNRSYYGAFDSNKGGSTSWRTTLDYEIAISSTFSLVPSLGYALHTQTLFLLSDDASIGNTKLRSTYATTFKGATLGIRAIMALGTFFSVEPSLFYDQVNYRSKADWNLISTFRHPLSFEDIADGYDIEAGLKGRYAWNDHYSFFLSTNYFYGNTSKGTDHLYQTNGQEPLTQFNGAVRHYWAIRAGLSFSLP